MPGGPPLVAASLLAAARFPGCAAHLSGGRSRGRPREAALSLQVTSGGAVRRLARREHSAREARLVEGTGTASSGQHSATAQSAGSGAAAGRTGALGSCDLSQNLCCKPTMTKPQYLACLMRNCERMQTPDPVCKAKGMCTKECSMGCCCLWLGILKRTGKRLLWLKEVLARFVVMISALQSGYMLPDSTAEMDVDPAVQARHVLDVILENCKWALGLPLSSLLLVSVHSQMKHTLRRCWTRVFRKKEEARLMQMARKEREKDKLSPEERAKLEVDEYLGEKEKERLGGVEHVTITKVSGISSFTWMLTQALGMGLYYFLMSEPTQIGICVMGKSGRLLVMARKPTQSALSAARMFRGVGISIIVVVVLANTWLRQMEFTLIRAMHAKDPAVRAKAAMAGPFARASQGKVHLFTLALALGYWLLNWAILKLRLRPWGYSDDTNYYECKEACVGQYFRGGVRGLIPCLHRRRKGGMRIFFGPYPDQTIFTHLGSAFQTLRNIEPCMVLPRETDHGFPEPGGGQSATAEDRAGVAQILLGALNTGLGTVSLLLFGIGVYNFLANVQNCPIGSVVRPCVEGADCTQAAKSPWMLHYLKENGLRETSDTVQDLMLPRVDLNTLGIWLRMRTLPETREKLLNISRQACQLRYSELFTAPNKTLSGATSDTIGKFNAANYLYWLRARGYNISFDEQTMHCQDCVRSFKLYYFTNFDNLLEIAEILVLAVSCYLTAIIYQLTTRKLANCPMVDLAFTNQPGSATDVDIDESERMCLNMIGHCFSYRYTHGGIPRHTAHLEGKLRTSTADTRQLMDPWCFDSTAKSWNAYSLNPSTNARLMQVNKMLLGILDGEEIVAAWSEAPMLTTRQKLMVYGGFVLCFVLPLAYAAWKRQKPCIAEAVIMEVIHFGLIEYFILRRRPQAGFILTSRRIFQISRLGGYRDIFGPTEPMLKLDVLVHNCGLSYASMTMEAHVPLHRRILGIILRMPVYRRGQLIVQGVDGIFKLWRVMGDAQETFKAISKVTYMEKLSSLDPSLGKGFMATERAMRQEKPQDPPGSCICCPHTPPPTGYAGLGVLDRYVTRHCMELDVYNRKLSIRPVTCMELLCGRSCRMEPTLCCCCRLEELVTEFVVTTHRTLVEQRSAHRYCRALACCRRTPGIRTTFLAHNRAAAYLCQKDARASGLMSLRQDLSIKLLQKDAREYAAGLMLIQRPYIILTKKDLPAPDKVWVSHISKIYDVLTQAAGEDSSEEASDATEEAAGAPEGMPPEPPRLPEAPQGPTGAEAMPPEPPQLPEAPQGPAGAEAWSGGGKAAKGRGKARDTGGGKGHAAGLGKGKARVKGTQGKGEPAR